MFGLRKKNSSRGDVIKRVCNGLMSNDIQPGSEEYSRMVKDLDTLTRRDWVEVAKVLIPAVVSGAVTVGSLWVIHVHEEGGHIFPRTDMQFIPKPRH